jgi:diguanylate cyclase (GGDEF)-like protein
VIPATDDEESRLARLRALDILDTKPEQAYDDIVRLAALICDMPIAIINFVDSDRQWGKALVGLEGSEAPREASFCATTIAREDGLLVVPDTHADPLWSSNPQVVGEPGLRFYAGTALVTDDGHALGSLCVADNRGPRELDRRALDALDALARQTVALLHLRESSMEIARNNEALHKLATRDSLTGLANRAFLNDALTIALRRRMRTKETLGVLFCDLDGFKQVNDVHGHQSGDTVLRAVAERLHGAARASDLVARISGDEFVIVCPALAAAEDLDDIAARLVAAVAEPIDVAGVRIEPCLSVGMTLARDGDGVDQLLGRADAAMYDAKRSAARLRLPLAG